MKIENILSVRNFRKQLTFNLIYEWEDIISSKNGIPIKCFSAFWEGQYNKINKYPYLVKLFHKLIPPKKNKSLSFIMRAEAKPKCQINKNIIPVIIDFWLEERDFPQFYEAYKSCYLILITSAEVYAKLKKNQCPLNIRHWPLSFPQTQINSNSITEKCYNLAFIGRKDTYFQKYLDLYCEKNPDFTYVTNSDDMENREYFLNNGTIIGTGKNRDEYFEIIKKSKITFYSTPGIDESKKGANGYNQVTPRFFEMLSGGCFVLGHYVDNEDTEYYELNKICPNIKTYEDFEYYINKYLNTSEIPLKRNYLYLEKHYTTTRAEMLINILKEYK